MWEIGVNLELAVYNMGNAAPPSGFLHRHRCLLAVPKSDARPATAHEHGVDPGQGTLKPAGPLPGSPLRWHAPTGLLGKPLRQFGAVLLEGAEVPLVCLASAGRGRPGWVEVL